MPPLAEEGDAASEVSEWELRERREREEERRAEAEALGAEDEAGTGEELPLFPPTPSFMASAGWRFWKLISESGLRLFLPDHECQNSFPYRIDE